MEVWVLSRHVTLAIIAFAAIAGVLGAYLDWGRGANVFSVMGFVAVLLAVLFVLRRRKRNRT